VLVQVPAAGGDDPDDQGQPDHKPRESPQGGDGDREDDQCRERHLALLTGRYRAGSQTGRRNRAPDADSPVDGR
jgi:hypothetical protein